MSILPTATLESIVARAKATPPGQLAAVDVGIAYRWPW